MTRVRAGQVCPNTGRERCWVPDVREAAAFAGSTCSCWILLAIQSKACLVLEGIRRRVSHRSWPAGRDLESTHTWK